MRNGFIFSLAVFMSVFLTTSCEKKDLISYPPTWKGFQFSREGVVVSNRQISAGDTLTITALQDQKGALINSTYYYWDITFSMVDDEGYAAPDSIFSRTIHTNYDGISSADPQISLRVPKNAIGRARVSFEAKYNYSANGIQVSNGAGTGGVVGNITPQSGSLSGGARGSAFFDIK